jgi:hypothetical protein
MPTLLADTRTTTLDDAKTIFANLAQAEISLAKLDAQYELKIAKLKAEHDANATTLRLVRDAHAHRLTTFILANPDKFVKPRAVATDFGRFGRRTVSNVEILDPAEVVTWAVLTQSLDTIKTTQSPIKPAIAKRLRAGETIPGCRMVDGEEAFYAVDKALTSEPPAPTQP